MASDKIKGLTVKIGADTSDFIKELKKVDKEINYSEKQARELQKQLELKFDAKTFSKAQKLVLSDLEAVEQKAAAINKQLRYLEESGNINTKGYKDLQVELEKTKTQASKLQVQLDKINQTKTNRLANSLKNLISNIQTSTAGVVAAAAAVYKLGKNAANAGGEIQDMADRLGITAEQVQRYDYIAMQSGVDTEQLVKSMAKARDAIGTAFSGSTNTATNALSQLFGSLANIPTSTEDGFNAIIEKLAEVKDSTLQAYYANEIFGERLATDLIPFINNGADKLAQLNTEFESLGYLTNAEVQELADFDDKFNNIQKRFQYMTYELGRVLLPIIETVFHFLSEYILPVLNAIFEILDPIISAISKIFNFLNTPTRWFLGLFTGDNKRLGSETPNQISNIINDTTYETSSIPTNNQTSNTYNTDNSQYNVELNVNSTGNLEYDAKNLADEVIKQIVVKKQAGGK